MASTRSGSVPENREPLSEEWLQEIERSYNAQLPATPFIGQFKVTTLIAEIRRLRSELDMPKHVRGLLDAARAAGGGPVGTSPPDNATRK